MHRLSAEAALPALKLVATMTLALLGGCAVYPPGPPVLADGSVAYGAPAATYPGYASYPAYSTYPYTYPVYSAYPAYPYYVGPPISLGLWFGYDRGYYRGGHGHYFGHGRGFGHAGWSGRRH